MPTYEEKMVLFAENVLHQAETERALYPTLPGHMLTVGDPRFSYSTALWLLQYASQLNIDLVEAERRYSEGCAAYASCPTMWKEKTYPEPT